MAYSDHPQLLVAFSYYKKERDCEHGGHEGLVANGTVQYHVVDLQKGPPWQHTLANCVAPNWLRGPAEKPGVELSRHN